MIDRRQLKLEARDILRGARSSPWVFALVYLLIAGSLTLLNDMTSGAWIASLRRLDPDLPVPDFLLRAASIPPLAATFIGVIVPLINSVLGAGQILYHLGIRSGREMPLSTLFEGFNQAGRVIVLALLQTVLITLWSFLFIIPGIVAAYRYRFALYDLLEDPSLRPLEALRMSSAQTYGYKAELFLLDLSFLGWFLLSALTLNLASVWVTPYYEQTQVGYFRTIKRTKRIGALPPEERRPYDGPDPFGPSV